MCLGEDPEIIGNLSANPTLYRAILIFLPLLREAKGESRG